MSKEYTTISYNIVTEDNKFFVYKSFDTDLVTLEIGHSFATNSFNSFTDLETVKNIISYLNAGHDFFETNDQEYWLKDNRNFGLREFEKYHNKPKFKIIKTTRHIVEDVSVEEIKI